MKQACHHEHAAFVRYERMENRNCVFCRRRHHFKEDSIAMEKSLPPEMMVEAIRTVAKGGLFFSPLFHKMKKEWLSQPEAFQKILSDREQEVLRLVVAGWNDERIGKQLNITASTVEAHRKHIRQKLELHNDRDLVGYAREWGLDLTIATNDANDGTA